jgi:hypothetical protein
MPIDPEGVRECFNPKSKFCAACLLAETIEDQVLCHISYLEHDHGIKIVINDEGKIKIHEDDLWKLPGAHISWILNQ